MTSVAGWDISCKRDLLQRHAKNRGNMQMCLAVQKKYRSKIDNVRMVTLMAFIEQDYKIVNSTTNNQRLLRATSWYELFAP